MDKLEVKHLAPYLPYDLNIQHKEGEIFLLTGFSSEHGNSFKMLELMDESFGKHFCNLIAANPILRPMSDLDKLIPNDKDERKYSDLGYFVKSINGFAPFKIDIYDLHYSDAQILFENHFDVFGLIDKGLAIDINTIQS